ncbi:hypothetical protein Hanom_Chr14g01321321 [Helianthus anomalus]
MTCSKKSKDIQYFESHLSLTVETLSDCLHHLFTRQHIRYFESHLSFDLMFRHAWYSAIN